MGFRDSHAAHHPVQGLVVNLLLVAALVLLLIGLRTPLLTVEQFYFFRNTVSLWSGMQQLRAEGEWGLFALIGLFSVAFPVVKILLLALVWNFGREGSRVHARHLHWLTEYGRWSMLDVFVVALIVVTVKLGALAQARVEPGIYWFSASVVLTMLLAHWIGRHANGTANR
jgi:paraquat-inducible protein A